MSITDKFSNFCSNIRIEDDVVAKIRDRYKAITKRINVDYWNSTSDTDHSLYAGSYGRGTAIHVSDVDVLVILPSTTYEKFNEYQSNGQSALLQEIKTVLQKTYSISHISSDGQVVVISFNDGIIFEIVPVFNHKDGISFVYPDTNGGGSWKVTKPRKEIQEINDENNRSNKNLKELCKMTRAWKDACDVPMGGLLIDTMAYNFIKTWQYKDKSFLYYDFMVRDFFEYLKNESTTQEYWLSPGAGQQVNKKGNFISKATTAYNAVKEAMIFENDSKEYSANQKWKEVFGSKFI